jgi:hypothetical protein
MKVLQTFALPLGYAASIARSPINKAERRKATAL